MLFLQGVLAYPSLCTTKSPIRQDGSFLRRWRKNIRLDNLICELHQILRSSAICVKILCKGLCKFKLGTADLIGVYDAALIRNGHCGYIGTSGKCVLNDAVNFAVSNLADDFICRLCKVKLSQVGVVLFRIVRKNYADVADL